MSFASRAQDWRIGPVIYQVFVDRFAPPTAGSPGAQQRNAPARLRSWTQRPVRGRYLSSPGVWSHELDFWGGDLEGLRQRLDYLVDLGVDVLYLNPIFSALTNHGYDTWDYHQVAATLGGNAALEALIHDVHARGLRLMLDGVFNHMGRGSPLFRQAQDPASPWHPFFRFTQRPGPMPGGAPLVEAVGWADVVNLPELCLDEPAVQDFLFRSPASVVQSWLQRGIDGWRLDVAYELGFDLLAHLTRAAHAARPDAAIVGEIWNYPAGWFPALDGVMNLHAREIVLGMLEERVTPRAATRMWTDLLQDCGIENLLRSWLVMDNHDTPRLATRLKSSALQKLARVLQFTLPGAVCLYYGGELGVHGGEDPANRAPMPWEKLTVANPVLDLHRRLLALRKQEPALRVGDFVPLQAGDAFAFLRTTDRVGESVLVAVNPGNRSCTAFIQLRDSRLQNSTRLLPLLEPGEPAFVHSGTVTLDLPARNARLLKPDTAPSPLGYCRYRRIP